MRTAVVRTATVAALALGAAACASLGRSVFREPVVNFRNGQSLVSINLENWRVHILEIGVDHRT